MSTALSSTDRGPAAPTGFFGSWKWAVADVVPMISFRISTLRGKARRVARYGLGLILLLTLAAAWLPAYLPDTDRRTDVVSLLPAGLVGVLVIAIVSAASSGGGRELMPREEAVAFPVSPTTDHLGALLMAPLNIAWLLQAWTLLGSFAYVAGASFSLIWTQIIAVTWLVTATTVAQVVGWSLEWLRRGRRGIWVARGLTAAVTLGAAYVVASGQLIEFLQQTPTLTIAATALKARVDLTVGYFVILAGLIVTALVATVLGAWVAAAVVLRPSRDVLRLESSVHVARRNPASDLAAMVRTDRVGIWRSVPLRRGVMVLAAMPGLVAIAGNLQWEMLTILPGLVASGGALLFGVNSWCLDGRGALWRDSLPVAPKLMFASRVIVLIEVLLVASSVTIAMAALRAGLPSGPELVAVGSAAMVVVLQVVSASLRWSVRRPFAVDLRSARATPAPPLVMVGYSARLALSTTLVGILFSVLSRFSWEACLLVALPMMLLSAVRLMRTADAWADPVTRARVVATVAS